MHNLFIICCIYYLNKLHLKTIIVLHFELEEMLLAPQASAKFVLMTYQLQLFFFFRAALAACGISQARGSNQSSSCWPAAQPPQCWIQAVSVTYTTTLIQNQAHTTSEVVSGTIEIMVKILVRTEIKLVCPIYLFFC